MKTKGVTMTRSKTSATFSTRLVVLTVVGTLTLTQSAEGQGNGPHSMNVFVTNDTSAPVPTLPPAIQPVNVIGGSGAYLNVSCPFTAVIYTVPAGKMLVIEDASGSAVSAADPGGIDPTINVSLRLTSILSPGFGIRSSVIVHSIGVPMAGGRTMKAYAGAETNVSLVVAGCPANVNASVSFSGQLIDSGQ